MEDVQFLSDGWFDYPAEMNEKDWFNLGGFSKVQPYYTRNGEVYALRDDVKPFVRSYCNTLAAILNPEVHDVGTLPSQRRMGQDMRPVISSWTRTMLAGTRQRTLARAFVTSRWLRDGERLSRTRPPALGRSATKSFHTSTRDSSRHGWNRQRGKSQSRLSFACVIRTEGGSNP
jgi:hypothetical protein